MLFLLYSVRFAVSGLMIFSLRKYSRSVHGIFDLSVYSVITGIIASVFFWCTGGFHIAINTRTLFFSAAYAAIALASQWLDILSLEKNGIAVTSVVSSSISLITTWLMGITMFSEDFTIISALRCLLMLLSGILIALPDNALMNRSGAATDKPDTSANAALTDKPDASANAASGSGTAKSRQKISGSVIIAVFLGINSTLAVLASKYFALDLDKGLVTDSNSFFFMTNILIILINLIILPLSAKRENAGVLTRLRSLKPKQYLLIATSTVTSNIESLLAILILSIGTVSLYAPLSSALTLIAGFAVGIIFFREKPRVIPIILAVASVLLGLLP